VEFESRVNIISKFKNTLRRQSVCIFMIIKLI